MTDEHILCPDCNDTGWLENRVDGKYPCTCMTECEPYQLLEAKCAALMRQTTGMIKTHQEYTQMQQERIWELESQIKLNGEK